MAAPPPYDKNYTAPPQGYQEPPPQGYQGAPPQGYQGQPPQPSPYPPPQGGGYPPPQGGYGQHGFANPGYGMPASQQQMSTNVVVVGQQPQQTVIIQERGVNHLLHFCISLFFWPWLIVWIILCITEGC